MLEGGEQAKRSELRGKKPTDNICFFVRNLTAFGSSRREGRLEEPMGLAEEEEEGRW